MKIRTTFALAVAALAVGIPTAAADPDGYQPQLQAGAPDAFDRYLLNNSPAEPTDAFGRYMRNNSSSSSPTFDSAGAAAHPDSRAVRPSSTVEVAPAVSGDGRDWTTGAIGVLGGALLALVAVVGASAIRGRGRLVLR